MKTTFMQRKAAVPGARRPIPHDVAAVPRRLHAASIVFDFHTSHL